MAYAAALANIFGAATHCTFPFAFASILGMFVICGVLGLWWLTRCARQKDSRRGQFGIGSLLLLTVFAAMFLGTVRWIVLRVEEKQPLPDSLGAFCVIAVVCSFFACISIPFVLCLNEALLWAAVWLIRSPLLQDLHVHSPIRVFRSASRFSLRDCILWTVVGIVAALILYTDVDEYRAGFPLNRAGIVVGITVETLVGLGLLFHWGPIIPCMLLGSFCFLLLTSPIASSHEEAVFKDFVVPLLGAICGAALGLVLEHYPCIWSKAEQDNMRK
jgi:hypothetical protein